MVRFVGAVDGNADVVGLFLRQLGELDTELVEVKSRHFFVQKFRQDIDPVGLVRAGVAFFPDRDCHFEDRITLPSIPASANVPHGEVDHESVRRLLEKADAAMYTAKRKVLRYWIHEHVADETLRGTVSRVSEPPPAA